MDLGTFVTLTSNRVDQDINQMNTVDWGDDGRHQDALHEDCHEKLNISWNNQCSVDEDEIIQHSANSLSTPVVVTVSVLCGCLSLLTVAGNTLVLLSFVNERRLRTYCNYYIVNLAICDFCTGLFTMPMYSAYWMLGYWPFGPVMCTFYLFYKNVFTHASFITVSVIAIDRYRALAYPIEHLKERNSRHARRCIAPTYIIPGLLWFFPVCIYPYIAPHYKDLDTSQQCNLLYTGPLAVLISTICISWIPLVITAVMYCKVYIIIRRHNNQRQKRKSVCSTVSSLELTEKKSCGKSSTSEASDIPPVTNEKAQCPPNVWKLNSLKGRLQSNNTSRRLHRKFTTRRLVDGFNLSSYYHVNRENARATRTLTFTYITMVISALPWTIVGLIVSVCPDCITPDTVKGCVMIAHLCSTLDPFCYAAANPVFRQTFAAILCRCRGGRRN